VPAAPAPKFNSKPNKDANAGQSPAMVGDRQRIVRPPVPTLSIDPAVPRAGDQRSGMEMAMAASADQLHPVGKR